MKVFISLRHFRALNIVNEHISQKTGPPDPMAIISVAHYIILKEQACRNKCKFISSQTWKIISISKRHRRYFLLLIPDKLFYIMWLFFPKGQVYLFTFEMAREAFELEVWSDGKGMMSARYLTINVIKIKKFCIK